MLVLAILSWGAVVALLAILVRLGTLAGMGFGGALRPRPRRRTAAPFAHIRGALSQRH